MSYPDLIEQGGKYWITETNKANARCHAVPNEFLNTLWSQFEINTVTKKNLVAEWKDDEIPENGQLKTPRNIKGSYSDGFTIDLNLVLATLSPGQLLLSSKDKNGKQVELKTGDFGAIEISLSDGERSDSWTSDPGFVKATGLEYSVSVIVDNGPRIIQFVIDGTVNNGRNIREFGWGRFVADMKNFNFENIETGKLYGESVNIKGKISELRLYNRPLMNTEIIGNHKYFQSRK
jgi:hypothetical protein